MKFSTVLLFVVSATAGVLDLSRQRRRVTHDPETIATIDTPRALQLAIKVRNAITGGNDNVGAAANRTSVQNSASNSTSIIDSRAANSTSSSSGARGSAAAAAGGGANSTSISSQAAGNVTNGLR